jgi:hypothetical protein
MQWRIIGGSQGHTDKESIEEAKFHVRNCRHMSWDKPWKDNVAEVYLPIYGDIGFGPFKTRGIIGYQWTKLDA